MNLLDGFAINSCTDVYVIQDSLGRREEAIFYLKCDPNWTDQLLILVLQGLSQYVRLKEFDVPGDDYDGNIVLRCERSHCRS